MTIKKELNLHFVYSNKEKSNFSSVKKVTKVKVKEYMMV